MKIFFSYHYEKELWRARQVRDVWVDQGGEALGFWDEAAWSEARKKAGGVERLIDECVAGATATVVLIAGETTEQEYVRYAVRRTHLAGKGLLAIHVHNIEDAQGRRSVIGHTRFGEIGRDAANKSIFFWQRYPTYRWMIDDGPANLKRWVSSAVP